LDLLHIPRGKVPGFDEITQALHRNIDDLRLIATRQLAREALAEQRRLTDQSEKLFDELRTATMPFALHHAHLRHFMTAAARIREKVDPLAIDTSALDLAKEHANRIFDHEDRYGDKPFHSYKRILTLSTQNRDELRRQLTTFFKELEVGTPITDLIRERAPEVSTSLDAWLIWMADAPMLPGKQYLFKLGTKTVNGVIEKIHHVVDVNTLQKDLADELKLNQIAQCKVTFSEPMAFDPYASSRATGGFIVIDRLSNGTVGAGMVIRAVQAALQDKSENVVWHEHKVNRVQRANQKGQKPCVVWLTGLSGSGKSTVANALEQALFLEGYHSYLLDGDNVRHGLNKDLSFSDEARVENIRRIGEVSKLFVDAGVIVITAFISPFRADRRLVRELLEPGEFVEVFVDTPIEVCEQRDPKGLYRKARAGEIKNFTGIDAPYEAPQGAELVLHNDRDSVEQCVAQVMAHLRRQGILKHG